MRPAPAEYLRIAFRAFLAYLHLNQLQILNRPDSMLLASPDGNRIAARKFHQAAVHDKLPLSVHHRDDLVLKPVNMIILCASRIDGDMLCK